MKSPSCLTTRFAKTFLAAATFAACGLSASAVELSLIRTAMENTGVDSDAAGSLRSNFTPGNVELRASLSGLTPGAVYHLNVDAVTQADVTADSRGRSEVRFRVRAQGARQPLDFDPRGHLVAVNDGTADVLTAVYSGEGESDEIRVDERTSLERGTAVTRGKVEARYLAQKNQTRFIMHLLAMERGTYTVYVDGQPEATVDLTRGRSRMLVFRTNSKAAKKGGHGNGSNNLDLAFDPRNKVIDVVAEDGSIAFSGVMLAQIRGVNAAEEATSETTLTSSGLDPDATATAVLSVNSNAEREFSVEVEDLPVGAYDLSVGDVVRGTINVTDDGTGKTSGEIEFSTSPDDGELLLDFDPAGQTIQISQGANVYFTGTVNTLTPTTGVTTSFSLPLLNQGVVAGSGDVDYQAAADATTFTVSVSGVAAGDYDVLVGGVSKATITVADVNGTLAGSVTFSSAAAAGELALDFDPLGETVDVAQAGGTVILSRPLPE
jgi:hypothetical protein